MYKGISDKIIFKVQMKLVSEIPLIFENNKMANERQLSFN